MLLFVGQFQHSLDAKGRLILPAKFRRGVRERAVTSAPTWTGCVALWTPGEFARKSGEYLEAESWRRRRERRQARYWATNSSDVEFESRVDSHCRRCNSRVRPTRGRRDRRGNLDHIELWNPARYAEQVSVGRGDFQTRQ